MESEEQEDGNPFDDLFFWLNLATADFTFGLFQDDEKKEQTTHEKDDGQ